MSSPEDEAVTHDFAQGAPVLAAVNIGGRFRPRVARDTRGVVVAAEPGGLLEVQFDHDHTELVRPGQLSSVRGFFDDDEDDH